MAGINFSSLVTLFTFLEFIMFNSVPGVLNSYVGVVVLRTVVDMVMQVKEIYITYSSFTSCPDRRCHIRSKPFLDSYRYFKTKIGKIGRPVLDF